ncbi:hypothetical protein BDY19DRAFT_918978 [Irpex rosettiformis]|uniref:Uncharacterized protein n=1 Tax=Irpex rosettiformis TaxID=378272 RepID=A0ACB8UI93_9APHY|nr:hypothetical protein BDY19DRAFT_918978 [Irpex rosettiformis]
MQLLSSGLRAQLGHSLHKPPGLPPGGAGAITSNLGRRSIHMPAWFPRAQAPKPSGAAAAFVKQARTLLTRVVGELTAPGAFNLATHVPYSSSGPSYSTNPFRFSTIQQRLNGPTRVTLSRPLWAPYVPRAPAMPRNVTQLGLGTARNFSSARPLFQNVVDNVPIAGRAFWEADWDVKMMKEREAKIKKYTGNKENRKSRKMRLEPTTRPVVQSTSTAEAASTQEVDLDHYFPAPTMADVTTLLLIPLAPTPTSRLPLPINPSVHTSNHPLIPFRYIASIHDDHIAHSLRVSSLFARLDTAHVFDQPGVSTAAFGHASGLCTVLEVKFSGWTESRVRSILGEAGTGWCVLEEVHENEHAAIEETLSEMSFDTRSNSPHPEERDVYIDPSTSFVLPTLDFSASAAASWGRVTAPALPQAASTPMSDLEFHNAWSSREHDGQSDSEDALSDVSLDDASADSWGDILGSASEVSNRPPSRASNEWTPLGFSSSFSSQINIPREESINEEPREYMF